MSSLKLVIGGVLTAVVAAGAFNFGRPSFAAIPQFGTSIHKSNVGTDPGSVKEGLRQPKNGDQLALFSGGCFWGVEEHFRQVPGVVATAVGYTGGNVPNPSYELVCTHTTGHTETVLIEFDPKKITYRQLVDSFWKVTDPTQIDRQGPDVGNNYRSAIWFFNEAQKQEAFASIIARQKKESGQIVTKVLPVQPFYLAEDYHQQYDEKSGTLSCPSRE